MSEEEEVMYRIAQHFQKMDPQQLADDAAAPAARQSWLCWAGCPGLQELADVIT